MSLPEEKVQRTLFDVPVLMAGLFEADNRYRVFREKILPALYARRSVLSKLYCLDNGRPAIEPVVAMGVTLLQFMEKAPDRRASENVRLHLGWKYALELELGYEGFHSTSLVYFRERLLEGGAERIGFDAVLDALEESGLVKKHSRQRLDSTHVVGCVSQMSRLEVIRETIGLVLEEIRRRGFGEELPNYSVLVERYCESNIQWHRMKKEDLIKKAEQAGLDALGLICWLRGQATEIRDSDRSLLLERVFLEQYEITSDTVWQRREEGSGFVKNPYDPDAQWASKDLARSKTWTGFKAQISETVSGADEIKQKGEPTEQFITEVTTTEAIAGDMDGMNRNLEAQKEHREDQPSELYVDAAYVTDDTLSQAREGGYELIGPARPCGNAHGNEFDAESFDVDAANRKAVCPVGHENRQCSLIHDSHKGAVYLRYEWAGLCDECSLRKQCTKSRNGRRILVVGIHHDLLQARRRQMKTEEFRQKFRRRSAIEGTISEFARLGGRRTRYRGLTRTTLANYFQGAAVNANRWIRLVQWRIDPDQSRIEKQKAA